MKMQNPFEINGVEGILDVILGCMLIFLLLSAMAQLNSRFQVKEVALPPIDLTKINHEPAEGSLSSSVQTTISLIPDTQDTVKIWVNNQEISIDDLVPFLKKLGPVAQVNIRRDPRLSCGIEDQIMLSCHQAGISQIAIVIQK